MDNALFLPSMVLLVSFVWMLAIKTPIAVAISLSTLLTLIAVSGVVSLPASVIISHRMAGGIESFTLLAIPMFILAGNLMGRGGMARRIMDFSAALLSKLPGGLAAANVLACMLFGTISGSAAAAVSSIGGAMIPEMKRKHYPAEYSVALTATSATTGLLIPPSNVIIVYAMSAGSLSITTLFLAGIIPGVLVGLCITVVAIFLAYRKGYGKVPGVQEKSISFFELFRSFMLAFPSLAIGVLVLVGIVCGLFSPTEAAAVSVGYAFVFAVIVYREVKLSDLKGILLESGITSAVVLLLIGASCAMSWVLSYLDIPQTLSAFLFEFSSNKWCILILINITLLLVGTFMDMTPAILIFTPIFLPLMKTLGIDPVHFGIIMIANLCVGLCTPPVGTCLFVGCTVGKTQLFKTTFSMIPFFLAMLVALVLIVVFPQISLYIPQLFAIK